MSNSLKGRAQVFAAVFLLLLAVAAGAAAADGKVVIQFGTWTDPMGGAGRSFQAMIDAFNASQEQFEVEYYLYPGGVDAARDQVLVEWASGLGPQVIQLSINWLGEFAAADVLHPLESLGIDLDELSLFPAFRDVVANAGEAPSLIPFSGILLEPMWYNMEHFDEAGLDRHAPPARWEELTEAGQRLTRRTSPDAAPERWGVQRLWWFPSWLFANLGEWVDENGRYVWDSQSGIEALEYLAELVSERHIATLSNSPNVFESGQSSIAFFGTPRLTPHLESDIEIGVAVVPQNHDGRPRMDGSFHSIGARKDLSPEEKEAVASFLRFTASAQAQAIMAAGGAGLPINPDAISQDMLQDYLAMHPLARDTMALSEYAVIDFSWACAAGKDSMGRVGRLTYLARTRHIPGGPRRRRQVGGPM